MRTTYDSEMRRWNYRTDLGFSFDPMISRIGRVHIELFLWKGGAAAYGGGGGAQDLRRRAEDHSFPPLCT